MDSPNLIPPYVDQETYPTWKDLEERDPWMRPNTYDKPYESLRHYLGTHFRLLKEEFVSDFREGYKAFMAGEDTSNLGIIVHRNAYYVKNRQEWNEEEKCFLPEKPQLEFYVEQAAQATKALPEPGIKPGQFLIVKSALCDDQMQMRAFIKESIFISFELFRIIIEPLSEPIALSKREKVVLLEPSSSFERCAPLLEGLKAVTTLPFEQSLVHLYAGSNQAPSRWINSEAEIEAFLNAKGTELDQSQKAAFRHALNRSIALIQGPPGTGKTFVGAKIVEFIISATEQQRTNESAAKKKKSNKKPMGLTCGPVILICRTNHALDQFVQLVTKFTDQIICFRDQGDSSASSEKSSFQGFVDEHKLQLTDDYSQLRQQYDALEKRGKQNSEEGLMLKKAIAGIERKNLIKILSHAQVVAMTTTRAASIREDIQELKAEVILVEEAAEIMEASVVTALLRSTKQLILIGDHLQLKPTVRTYDLARDYHLDISLFERLIVNGFESVILTTQRRMRPEIAKPIRQLYPCLVDGKQESDFKDIRHLHRNYLFFTHEFLEQISSKDLVTSKSNRKEAELVLAFTNFLIQKAKYSPSQISIITFFSAQASVLEQIKKQDYSKWSQLQAVRIFSIEDSKEAVNDIAILSLVSSNPEGDMYHQLSSNRMTFVLSRAKAGLFLFGNQKWRSLSNEAGELEASNSLLKVIEHLNENESIVDEFSPSCLSHKKPIYSVKFSEFKRQKFNQPLLCDQSCSFKFTCGHLCQKKCHLLSGEHKGPEKCSLPCIRPTGCSHPCEKACHRCKGHDSYKCLKPCKRTLPCGHTCKQLCYVNCLSPEAEAYRFLCSIKVVKTLPCGHEEIMECGKDEDFFFLSGKCSRKCLMTMECGHVCPRDCRDCINGHADCQALVRVERMSCEHHLEAKCFEATKIVKGLLPEPACLVGVEQELPCSHLRTMPCWRSSLIAHGEEKPKKCEVITEMKLQCGHSISMPCFKSREIAEGSIAEPLCSELVYCSFPCGHSHIMPCHESVLISASRNYPRCQKQVEVILSCSHTVVKPCFKRKQEHQCHEIIEYRQECGHKVKIRCHLKTHITSGSLRKPKCQSKCGKNQPCGHKCSAVCSACEASGFHEVCPVEIKIAASNSNLNPIGKVSDLEVKEYERANLGLLKLEVDALEAILMDQIEASEESPESQEHRQGVNSLRRVQVKLVFFRQGSYQKQFLIRTLPLVTERDEQSKKLGQSEHHEQPTEDLNVLEQELPILFTRKCLLMMTKLILRQSGNGSSPQADHLKEVKKIQDELLRHLEYEVLPEERIKKLFLVGLGAKAFLESSDSGNYEKFDRLKEEGAKPAAFIEFFHRIWEQNPSAVDSNEFYFLEGVRGVERNKIIKCANGHVFNIGIWNDKCCPVKGCSQSRHPEVPMTLWGKASSLITSLLRKVQK